MTAAQGSAYESNYSIVEELNARGELEIRFYPMVKSEGNWSRLSEELYFYKNPSISFSKYVGGLFRVAKPPSCE